MPELSGLTVFFPSYNDGLSLQALVPEAKKAAALLTRDYEILIIDDGSGEETRAILKQMAVSEPKLRVVFHEQNLGYGGALRSGFEQASKEWVFYTDGDGQYDPAEMGRLAELVQGDVAFVNGYKTSRSDAWYRVLIGHLYNFAVRRIFKIRFLDVDCDFRLLRRDFLGKAALKSSSGAICVGLTAKACREGINFAECPVSHYPRRHGRSVFFNPAAVARTLKELCALKKEIG